MAGNELREQAGEESRWARRRRAWVYAMVAAGLILVFVLLILRQTGTGGEVIPGDSVSEEEFTSILLEECTWEDIIENAHPKVKYFIPAKMPEQFEFLEGEYHQANAFINMQFIYNNFAIEDGLLILYCSYFGKNSNAYSDMSITMKNGKLHTEDWNGVSVDYVENGERTNMMWLQGRYRFTVFCSSWLDRDQMQEIFRCIMKVEP